MGIRDSSPAFVALREVFSRSDGWVSPVTLGEPDEHGREGDSR